MAVAERPRVARRSCYQDVNAAELLQRRRNQAVDAVQPVQVGGIRHHLGTRGFSYFAGRLLEVGRGAAADGDFRALLGQHLGAGAAQSLAGPTDDCNLAFKPQVHCNVLVALQLSGRSLHLIAPIIPVCSLDCDISETYPG